MPYTFRSVEAPENTVVGLIVTGEAGQGWFLLRKEARWSLFTETSFPPVATVTIDQEAAWKLFTKGMAKEDAMRRASIEGNQELAASIFEAVSIIA